MADRVAVYPGSFDPPTLGHIDIIERAAELFDTLIVAVAKNSEKHCLFSADERIKMLEQITSHVKNVETVNFRGLTVDLARERGAIVLIRGLRAISDFEYEMTMAATNRKLYADCDTISLMPSEQFMFISSRLVKEIVELGGDVSAFVHPLVMAEMKTKINAE